MMDSGVVVRSGLQVGTIGPIDRAPSRLDLLLRPAPGTLADGEHPGPLRRRQGLSDHPSVTWLRPRRGIPQETRPLYPGFFEFVHDVRARGKRLLGALIGQLLAPPCNPS